MKQKISSIPTSSDLAGDYEKSDVEHSESLLKPLTEKLEHLAILLQNQMRNKRQCLECRQTVSGIMKSFHEDLLSLCNLYSICEECGEIFYDYGHWNESVIQANSPTMHISIRFSPPKIRKMDEKIHTLQNKIQTVNYNIENLSGEHSRLAKSLQRLSEECSSLRTSAHQQSSVIYQCKSSQEKVEQDLLEIKQKIEDLHYVTYDGTFIWRVDDFRKKFGEAVSGQQTWIYSPVFYSSTSGYKMRVRLYPYGDGDAHGSHMSIFLVILQGDFDPILTWPFSFSVAFCLFDQTGQGHHVIDSFYPDTTSASFQRPRSKENIGSGILKFFPLALIPQQAEDYILNDTMFIKVMVNFFGTPRSILPYTLNVDPGLPAHEQEARRERIIEQHKEIRAKLLAQVDADDEEVTDRSLLPVNPPVPAGITQQTVQSTTNSDSIPCEDILYQ